jgi:hypothetical protein
MVGSSSTGTVVIGGVESPETFVGTNTNLTIITD